MRRSEELRFGFASLLFSRKVYGHFFLILIKNVSWSRKKSSIAMRASWIAINDASWWIEGWFGIAYFNLEQIL